MKRRLPEKIVQSLTHPSAVVDAVRKSRKVTAGQEKSGRCPKKGVIMNIVGYTRGGKTWTPKFIESIDVDKCIGCGRCYKVCGREVLELIEKPFEGEDEYGDDMGNKVMSVAKPENCIGCEACLRVCTKKSHIHIEL